MLANKVDQNGSQLCAEKTFRFTGLQRAVVTSLGTACASVAAFDVIDRRGMRRA